MNARKNAIEAMKSDLLSIYALKADSLETIANYYVSFPGEEDYNVVQYGCLLAYCSDCREFLTGAGYKTAPWSDDKVWSKYKEICGVAVRKLMKEYFGF